MPDFLGEIQHSDCRAKIDDLDRKILTFLGVNCRFSLSVIAKALRKDPAVIKYRLDSLEKRKIVPGYLAQLDLNKLGLTTYIFLMRIRDFAKQQELLSLLQSSSGISVIQVLGGSYDLRITLNVKSTEDLGDFMSRISGYVSDMETYPVLSNHYVGLKVFGRADGKMRPNKSSFQSSFLDVSDHTPDQQDIKLLELIQSDARISLTDLSAKMNLSIPSLEARLRKLVSSRIITAFFPQVSMLSLGYQWYNLFLKPIPGAETSLNGYLRQTPEVTFVTKMSGNYLFMASVFVDSQLAYYRFLDRVRQNNKIQDYSTSIVFEQVKNRVSLA